MHKCWCGNKKLLDYNTDYYCCKECGTLLTKKEITDDISVVKDDKTDFYGKRYWLDKMLSFAQKDSITDLLDLYFEGRVLYWMKYFLKYALPMDGPIAEVGCGLGEFSFLLKKLGFKQKAFEISPDICRYIEEEFQINIECSTFKKLKKKYYGIVAFDLVEHLTDPERFIKDVYESLDDNGIFMVQMPRYDKDITFDEMLRTKNNFSKLLLPEEHIYLFSIESAEKILMSNGFKSVEFLPAFFGDEYDMFLVAFKGKIRKYDEKSVDDYLNRNAEIRMVKNMMSLFQKLRQQELKNALLEEHCNSRLDQILKLTEMVHVLENRQRGVL